MAENDEVAAAVARLEAALTRIAVAAGRPRPEAEPAPETAEIAARLDEIIAEVRNALAGAPQKEPA
jgi:hypothetical protein